MAERGRFARGQSGGSSYAGIPAQIINQIRQQSTGVNTSNTSQTIKSNPENGASKVNASTKPVRTREEMAQRRENALANQERVKLQQALMGGYNPFALSAEDIAKDPTLSSLASGTTLAQAKTDYEAALSVQSLMPPGSLATSKSGADRVAYAKRMAIYNKAYAALTPAQTNAQNVYSALGGSVSVNNKPSYGSSAQDIAKTWASLGNLDMAKEIMGSVFGSPTNGNPAGTIPNATGTINPTANIEVYLKPSGGISLTPFKPGKKRPTA